MAEHAVPEGKEAAPMADSIGTDSDPAAQEWAINDQVTQLRLWGTDLIYPLEAGAEPAVGAAETCPIRIEDPSGQVSRTHARIVRTTSGWGVRDLDSKNGIHIDGSQRKEGALLPGTELGIGDVVLIAESRQLIALRGFLARLIGWDPVHQQDVDRALRMVRLAATRRAPLVLSGNGDLVPIALSLHIHVRGHDKPFILCDPRRRRSKADVRVAENVTDVQHALRSAIGGSLCLLRRRLPPDAAAVLDEVRRSRPRVQLIICATEEQRGKAELLVADPLIIPPLSERRHELDRIIFEYATEATRDLGAPRSAFTEKDHEWVRMHAASSLTEIEKATRRLVAVRTDRTMSGAATRLGMATVSLSRWLERRYFLDELGLKDPPVSD
jgi:hypothetical protein